MQFIGGFDSGVCVTGQEEYGPENTHANRAVVVRSGVDAIIIRTGELSITITNGVINVFQTDVAASPISITMTFNGHDWGRVTEEVITIPSAQQAQEIVEEHVLDGAVEALSMVDELDIPPNVEVEIQAPPPLHATLPSVESIIQDGVSSRPPTIQSDDGIEESKSSNVDDTFKWIADLAAQHGQSQISVKRNSKLVVIGKGDARRQLYLRPLAPNPQGQSLSMTHSLEAAKNAPRSAHNCDIMQMIIKDARREDGVFLRYDLLKLPEDSLSLWEAFRSAVVDAALSE